MPPKRKAALANQAIQSTTKRSRVNNEPLPEQRSHSASSSNAPLSLSPDEIQKLVREAFQKGIEEGRQGTSSVDPANSQVLPSTCRSDSVHTDSDSTIELKQRRWPYTVYNWSIISYIDPGNPHSNK
ncbi:uncharacterized protein LOC117327813 isoform X2 [Pecten maximus]|nr:uncharacterized protein LOC117327813 isoform X2 [Pecten maximus]